MEDRMDHILAHYNYIDVDLFIIAEEFSCLSGYYKCKKSFCLERRFVCDGVKQCEYGEDEENCGNVTIFRHTDYWKT